MSKATHMSRLIRHLHSVATEPCSAIVFSRSEYAILLSALLDFRINHTRKNARWVLTPDGVAACDSLYTHLKDYADDLEKSCLN